LIPTRQQAAIAACVCLSQKKIFFSFAAAMTLQTVFCGSP